MSTSRISMSLNQNDTKQSDAYSGFSNEIFQNEIPIADLLFRMRLYINLLAKSSGGRLLSILESVSNKILNKVPKKML